MANRSHGGATPSTRRGRYSGGRGAAAKRLGLTKSHVAYLVKSGKLPAALAQESASAGGSTLAAMKGPFSG